MSYNGPEDPTYNPFADRSTTSQGFYSSAFFPNIEAVPALRRRPASLLVERPEEQRKNHVRVKSEVQIVPPNTAGLHPLKSALVATVGSVLSDATQVTRPNLSRVVSEANPKDALGDHNGESTSKSEDVANEERDVIVHHVCAHSFFLCL